MGDFYYSLAMVQSFIFTADSVLVDGTTATVL